jgi:hypothetical protein
LLLGRRGVVEDSLATFHGSGSPTLAAAERSARNHLPAPATLRTTGPLGPDRLIVAFAIIAF